MNNILARSENFVRRMLFIGVLAALFFSNAEGITLLPFPDVQPTDATVSITVGLDQAGSSYSASLKTSRGAASKTVKVKDLEPVAERAATVQIDAETRFLLLSSAASPISHTPPFSSRLIGSRSTRGPPR